MMSISRGSGPRLDQDRYRILEMVQDGTISPDDGARLLEAFDRVERQHPTDTTVATTQKARNVRIRLTKLRHKRTDVDIALPIGLVDFALSLAERLAPGRFPELPSLRTLAQAGVAQQVWSFENGEDLVEISFE